MKTSLKEIQEFLKNKEICLLGNACSILNTEKNIDKFDVVCRMNRGCPQEKEKYIGSRTDILFLSTKIRGEDTDEKNMENQFNPKYVIWMTYDNYLASQWVKNNAYQNPKEDIKELRKLLSSKPSTGCYAIYFLLKHVQFKKLTIYGFTFFEFGIGTWYHQSKNQHWHNGKEEKELILNLIKDRKDIRLIME